jgi:hypothetical protein
MREFGHVVFNWRFGWYVRWYIGWFEWLGYIDRHE